ncbi:MAG TPA: putative metal-dependent hydrolase [Thermoanaerobaculia bacterium]|nr:putative metal-dependent hydrolase [Thermoanaerobaculia bacterium]
MSDLRYPVGRFEPRHTLTSEQRRSLIGEIAAAPQRMREAVRGLGDSELDTPYRDGGWKVRQVVHHLPDSHMNAYVRLKFTLTEQEPVIKPYDQETWAMLPDSQLTPIATSLTLLDSLHERWTTLMTSMAPADFQRKFTHPEHGLMTLDWLVAMYAWHGRHHVGHIASLRERKGW